MRKTSEPTGAAIETNSLSLRARRAAFALALAAPLAMAVPASAARLTCLVGNDPAVAGDAAAITAARAAIETTCPCASFDGAQGNNHASYIACAADVVRERVQQGALRKQCQATVKNQTAASTCGFPALPRREVCIKTITLSGRVSCAIKSATDRAGEPAPQCFTKPGKFDQVACPEHTHCIDAADTDGDFAIRAPGDSGTCNPAPTPTPTPAPTPTPTQSPPPVPLPTGEAGATLAQLVNAYRLASARPEVPLSPALAQTAAQHVADLMAHPEIAQAPCNAFSWSTFSSGLWTACCFTPDNAQAQCMQVKPTEISSGLGYSPYPGNGYELIAFANPMTPERAIDLFSATPGFNAVLLNLPPWGPFAPWPAMGAAVSGSYASVWFGDATDPQPWP